MTKSKSPQEQKLWDEWLKSKDDESANTLIHHYQYLVAFHVDRIAAHLPTSVNRDDVKSFGLIGLFDALKKFDPSRDLKFDTYASFRVRGAIMDGLRREDWLPRSIRDKTKKIEKAAEELEQQLNRSPYSEEIAETLDMNVKEVESLVRDSLFANVLSLEEKSKDQTNDPKEGVGYSIPDDNVLTPDEKVITSELHNELAEGIQSLKHNEQLVISLFYHDELTLTEIGTILGLTTSRISQIHQKSIFKLRHALQKIQSL